MGSSLVAVFNETRKGLLITWSYRFNTITELLTLGFIFIGILFFMGNGQVVPERVAPTLVGYLMWYYAGIAIGNMSYSLSEEAQTGTLEQMYMSPTPAWLLILGRTLGTLIWASLQIVILSVALILLLGVSIPLRWQALPVVLLTVIGLFGFGFIMGGATLAFKHIQALSNLISNLLLFLNGAILPVDRLPPWLETVSKLLPSTQGIIVLRHVLIDGQSLRAAWADGSLVLLFIHSVVYFTVGLLIFRWFERIARQHGTLGQY